MRTKEELSYSYYIKTGLKLCSWCGEIKAVNKFACVNHRTKERHSYCKDCYNFQRKNRRQIDSTYDKIYASIDAQRHRTHIQTLRLIHKGILIKEPCSMCHNTDLTKIQAHHFDYSKPEKVIWVC